LVHAFTLNLQGKSFFFYTCSRWNEEEEEKEKETQEKENRRSRIGRTERTTPGPRVEIIPEWELSLWRRERILRREQLSDDE
jgi:hypothetical protein